MNEKFSSLSVIELLNPLDFPPFWNTAHSVLIFEVDALPCTMEAVMPKCAGCGTETDLHELDVPMCPACVAERERLQSSIASLSAELTSARELYRKAMEESDRQKAMCRGLPEGHPDRTVAAGLEEKAKTSGERYWEALRVYSLALQKSGWKNARHALSLNSILPPGRRYATSASPSYTHDSSGTSASASLNSGNFRFSREPVDVSSRLMERRGPRPAIHARQRPEPSC